MRCFNDDNIIHVDGSVNPVRDKEVIDIELQLKDVDTVEKKMSGIERKAKTGDKETIKVYNTYKKIFDNLMSGQNARSTELDTDDEVALMEDLQLLTAKPVLYLCNVDEASVKDGNEYVDQIKEAVKNENAEVLILGAGIEADINELDTFEERQMFLEELDLKEPGVNRLIRSAYNLLDLQTYFTAGVKEVRAWTVKKNQQDHKLQV